ncbi:MAG: ROK family protein [Dysgonamonadaceae bacterium]|jgi:glucokinase|nr:ROK family protein [Dysgonamonadaceae bacterium]
MMNNIGIDMGGTRLKIGLFDKSVLIRQTVVDAASKRSFEETIKTLNGEMEKLLKSASVKDISGIGMSVPGIVDTENNRIISINEKYKEAEDFDFNGWADGIWHCRLVTENDARAALVGEWQRGSGKGVDNIVMMTLGTGIGGAALINGKLLYGKHFQAGCLGGHFTVDYKGKICNCGNKGCAESIASGWALSDKTGNEMTDYKTLCESCQNGNTEAQQILDASAEVWGACAVNLIHAFDPEMLIVGGGIMKSSEMILPRIREWVEKYAWTPWGKIEVRKSSLEDSAALFGINYLLLNQ